MRDGFLKVAAGVPVLRVADCCYNEDAIFDLISQAEEQGVKLLVLPELCLTGSTCGDLFFQKTLQEGAARALENLLEKTVYEEIITKGFSAGVIGVYHYNFLTLDEVRDKEFAVVLDGLETPGNLGTILRTCDAYDVDLVMLVDSKTNVFNPKVVQSSRGMSLLLNIVNVTYEEAQKFLLDNNFDIYLGEPELGKSYLDYDYKNKTALVFGNERFGINKKWYDNLNYKLFVPMYGKMTSLNVSVAASIVIAYTGIKRHK